MVQIHQSDSGSTQPADVGRQRGQRQEAQMSDVTNCATLFCKVVEVLQDFLSEKVDKKFTTDYNVA